MPTIAQQQQELLDKLMAEKRIAAEEQRLLVAHREGADIFVHPLTQIPYKWVGRELVQISPRYIDGIGDLGYEITIYRVDNMVTGRTRWPTYAIPYRDKFGIQHLATGKKHPHLAVEDLKRQILDGHVSKTCPDFNAQNYGYDYKMFIKKMDI